MGLLPIDRLAPSELIMTIQPDSPAWSGAVQRELDGVQRSFAEFTSRLDKLLTLTEYHADMRAVEIRLSNTLEKVQDTEKDFETLKRELRESYNSLRTEIAEEVRNRQSDHKEYVKARQSQFRWLISMVMIPIAIALVQLLMTSHK